MSRSKVVTRRAFGRLLAAGPLAAAPQTPSREEELRAAQQRRAAAAETLGKFKVSMATEPAVTFRP